MSPSFELLQADVIVQPERDCVLLRFPFDEETAELPVDPTCHAVFVDIDVAMSFVRQLAAALGSNSEILFPVDLIGE